MATCQRCGDPTRRRPINRAIGSLCTDCMDGVLAHLESLRASGNDAKADRILRYGLEG